MKNISLFPTKIHKKTFSMRLPEDLRSQAEQVAKKNNVTLTAVLEAGLKLLLEKVKNEPSK
jgi:hypothetical protein